MKNFEYYSTNVVHEFPFSTKSKEEEKNKMKLYRKERFSLLEEFKRDLFEEFEVSENPKREKCFDLAWEHGHSSGLQEVYNYFCDFVELIK